MPITGTVLLVVAILVWLVGVNVIAADSYERRGEPRSAGFRPFAAPWWHFDRREWLRTTGVFVASMVIGMAGLILRGP